MFRGILQHRPFMVWNESMLYFGCLMSLLAKTTTSVQHWQIVTTCNTFVSHKFVVIFILLMMKSIRKTLITGQLKSYVLWNWRDLSPKSKTKSTHERSNLFISTTFTPIEHHNCHNCETSFNSPNSQRSKTVLEEKKNFVLKVGIGFCKDCHQSKKSFNNKWGSSSSTENKSYRVQSCSKLKSIIKNHSKLFMKFWFCIGHNQSW